MSQFNAEWQLLDERPRNSLAWKRMCRSPCIGEQERHLVAIVQLRRHCRLNLAPMTSGGVAFRAKIPHQASVSKSGKPASIVICVSLSNGSCSRPNCSTGRSLLVSSCGVMRAADPRDEIDVSTEDVIHGGVAAAVRHVRDLHAGLLCKHRYREMAKRPMPTAYISPSPASLSKSIREALK
jgi:hypothetical protein